MKSLNERLREGDPLRFEPELPPRERDDMRRAVVAAAAARAELLLPRWREALALAAMALIAVLGAAAARRFAADVPGAARASRPSSIAQTTQVQFQTPGGTRIIWTLDPAFQLGDVRP